MALTACQKKELAFEERFHSANLAAVPGEKPCRLLAGKLKPSAAFLIGQQATRENSRIEGLVAQPADHNQIRFHGPDLQLLLDEAGEALAVACGVDRAEWRARLPYLMLDGGENQITNLGIRSMSYGIAMAGFQKRLAALPAFARGADNGGPGTRRGRRPPAAGPRRIRAERSGSHARFRCHARPRQRGQRCAWGRRRRRQVAGQPLCEAGPAMGDRL